MDDVTADAATVILFPDPGDSKQWFDTIRQAYEDVAQSGELDWGTFTTKLGETYGQTAEEFAGKVEQMSSSPMEVIKGIAEADPGELQQLVEQAMQGAEGEGQEGEGEEFDQAAYDAFIQGLQQMWDGAEDTWQQFIDWARYNAYEAGEQIGQAWDRIAEYVTSAGDKVSALLECGIQVAAKEAK